LYSPTDSLATALRAYGVVGVFADSRARQILDSPEFVEQFIAQRDLDVRASEDLTVGQLMENLKGRFAERSGVIIKLHEEGVICLLANHSNFVAGRQKVVGQFQDRTYDPNETDEAREAREVDEEREARVIRVVAEAGADLEESVLKYIEAIEVLDEEISQVPAKDNRFPSLSMSEGGALGDDPELLTRTIETIPGGDQRRAVTSLYRYRS
jgi:ribosomal protein L14E/L6E/L27E